MLVWLVAENTTGVFVITNLTMGGRKCRIVLVNERTPRGMAEDAGCGRVRPATNCAPITKKGDMKVKELTEMMVKSVVDYPEQVGVTEVEGTDSLILEIRVAQEDMGKVIGKSGRIINAMRTVVSAASAAKGGKRTSLEIIEPEGEREPKAASDESESQDRWA